MEEKIIEANIDALPGPTHLFSGLGVGNVASIEHRNQTAYPKQAALENLAKAELVAGLGIPQYVWLPPDRPNLEMLRKVGFNGSAREITAAALEHAPSMLQASLSSAFMWAANSGTFSPAVDCDDNCYHFTPANLISSLHRGGEANERAADLHAMLAKRLDRPLILHDPLPELVPLRDEGAANHMRLSDASGLNAINVFVYGDGPSGRRPQVHFPRQTRLSVEALARQHRLPGGRVAFVQQHPAAIDAGVFHNDVIATSHRNFLFYHELAFADGEAVEMIKRQFASEVGQPLTIAKVPLEQLSLTDAVESYLFNSQIVVDDTDTWTIICPNQCQSVLSAKNVVEGLIADSNCPIAAVRYISLQQSMSGGGGPACVRLRLPIAAQAEILQADSFYRLTDDRAASLRRAIAETYPEELTLGDFTRTDVLDQVRVARESLLSAADQ
ncbi:MAG TPA: succinylarginine dihydrolase [Planctomycetaceae bacterium]|nr:succinylarginine dihydrolase [Planctomycetaceae bacterium]